MVALENSEQVQCTVCGGTRFTSKQKAQQGTMCCEACGVSIELAKPVHNQHEPCSGQNKQRKEKEDDKHTKNNC